MKLTKTQTQLQWVRTKLKRDGFITRNEALRNYISRLSSRIWDLRDEGLNIEGERIKISKNHWDYKYTLIDN